MKKIKPKPLALNTSTIAILSSPELSRIAGGGSDSVNWSCSTHYRNCNSGHGCSASCLSGCPNGCSIE
jgi:hypothetical protein